MFASLAAIAMHSEEAPSKIIISITILTTAFSVARLCEMIWLVQSIAAIITTSQHEA